MYLKYFLRVRRLFKRCGLVYNLALDPNSQGTKPPSSRLRTFYSVIGNGSWQKTHVFKVGLFIRHQFKCCCLVYNTTLGPSGHGKKPPSPRLGTLYSPYRQRFMTKIHVLRLVLFVRRQLKRCVLILNTTLGPSGHDTKPPSSRLGTLYSRCRPWFVTKIHVFRVALHVRRQLKRRGRYQTPHWGPVAMARSHHRRGWGPSIAIISNGLWQKSTCLG